MTVDALQFHSSYDSFPAPLLLQTVDGSWLTNPAADAICLSRTDLEQLAAWDGNTSLWLAGQFFYVHGHRTAEGLFLLLDADAFLSSSAINLSSQLRQRLSLAFSGLSSLNEHLSGETQDAKEDLSVINRALFQIYRVITELDTCAETELSCHKVCLDLTHWLRRLGGEIEHWGHDYGVALRLALSAEPLSTMADPKLLDCLVAHLVSNAIKTASDGRAEIAISLKKQGEQAILTLDSNGVAFSPTVLTDPLWNQPARLLPGRGLGLGLPIAQRIAALHDGTLMVVPTKNGSQVVFSIPLSVPDNYLSSPAPRVEPTGGFSLVRIILSDALPPAAFHPDYPDYEPGP